MNHGVNEWVSVHTVASLVSLIQFGAWCEGKYTHFGCFEKHNARWVVLQHGCTGLQPSVVIGVGARMNVNLSQRGEINIQQTYAFIPQVGFLLGGN